jgi:ferric-dicitrate binding protein FerR (iron transport regulator)
MDDSSKRHVDENDIPRRVRELPLVEADADFRERLKSTFVEGRLEAGPSSETTGAGVRARISWWRWAVPAAAAAVVLLAVVSLNRAPAIRVAQVSGHGTVRVDGHPIALDDAKTLDASIRAGSEIETPPDALVDLLAGDVMLLEVTGGTRVSIPSVPARWFGRAVACSLSAGEMRIKTGRRFPGDELVVNTPEGRVAITGTMLSIERDAGGTCVCVVEGTASVGMNGSDMQAVKPGYRKVMFSNGTAKILPIEPVHRDGVLNFDARVGSLIKTK